MKIPQQPGSFPFQTFCLLHSPQSSNVHCPLATMINPASSFISKQYIALGVNDPKLQPLDKCRTNQKGQLVYSAPISPTKEDKVEESVLSESCSVCSKSVEEIMLSITWKRDPERLIFTLSFKKKFLAHHFRV